MAVKIGINGFGRIGRLVFRAALEGGGVDIVGLNDLSNIDTSAYLLKYDSVHGRYPGEVAVDGANLVVDGKAIPYSQEKDPTALPWGKLGAGIVVESTGVFRNKETAGKHLEAGAEYVIISAPAKGDIDFTVVIGINDGDLDLAKHKVISNASCTTNCLAPVVKVLNDKWGVERGLMTTIHSYTNDQRLIDFYHSDLRRSRAAAVSMIPTSTGAAKAIALVIPELKGKMDGMSIRVPTPNVSLVDLVATLKTSVTPEEINTALKAAADGELKGILGYTEDPVVSIDFNHCPLSSIADLKETRVIEGNMIKVLAWYDNEWGYSCRCVDLAKLIAAKR
jgi:glyceraldehyde 3-phosphate dehydrogenase